MARRLVHVPHQLAHERVGEGEPADRQVRLITPLRARATGRATLECLSLERIRERPEDRGRGLRVGKPRHVRLHHPFGHQVAPLRDCDEWDASPSAA